MPVAEQASTWQRTLAADQLVAAPSGRAISKLLSSSLRVRLILLVAITVLPLVVASMISATQRYEQERQTAELALVDTAKQMAASFDRKTKVFAGLVRVFAKTPSAETDQTARLRKITDMAMSEYPFAEITSADPSALSDPTAPELNPGLNGVRIISPFSSNNPTGPAIGIIVPDPANPNQPAALKATLSQAYLLKFLTERQPALGYISAVMDQNDRVVARNVDGERYVGTIALAPMREAMARQPTGFLRTKTVNGIDSSIAFARAPLTGFTVAVAIPSSMFDLPRQRGMIRLLLEALIVVSVAVMSALLMANQISKSLRSTARHVSAGQEPRHGFSEIATLAKALKTASHQRDETISTIELQQKQTHAILDALPLIVVAIDADQRIVYMNAYGRSAVGSAPHVTADQRDALIHPDDLSTVHAFRQGHLDSDRPTHFLVRFNFGGGYRWYNMSGVTIPPRPDGGSIRVNILLDVQAEHEARETTLRANAELEYRVTERTQALAQTAADLRAELHRTETMQKALSLLQKREALSRLAGGIAHDVNNVLAVISNCFDLIEMTEHDPTLEQSLNRGRTAIDNAAGLVRILGASARQHPLIFTTIDTKTVLKQIAIMCRHALGQTFTLALDVNDDLAPISTDREMLQAALLNLATNAGDAMKGGGQIVLRASNVPATTLDATDADGAVAISISDAGHGMSAEEIARATEPFFTTKAERGASGLGLTMVDGFVSQSDGKLSIDSKIGRGTTITIVLPAQSESNDGGRPTGRKRPPSSNGRTQTILVVDDNTILLDATADALRSCGYTVLEAADAAAAFAIAEEHPEIELVLSDIIMPNENGISLANRLAVLRPSLPVILITGFTDAENYSIGCTVLRKPCSLAKMLEAFDAVFIRKDG